MNDLFLPYLYFPSGNSTYFMLSTPWAVVKLERSVCVRILYSVVAILIGSILLYVYQGFRWKKKTSSKKPSTAKSALEESWEKKGKNSYYYAHQPATGKKTSLEKTTKKTLTKYSWTDEQKNVKIYITQEGVSKLKDNQIKLDFGKNWLNFEMQLSEDKKEHTCLIIKSLYGDISDCTWKRSKNTFTLTLMKLKSSNDEAFVTWKSLNGAIKNIEDNVQYDESLYD